MAKSLEERVKALEELTDCLYLSTLKDQSLPQGSSYGFTNNIVSIPLRTVVQYLLDHLGLQLKYDSGRPPSTTLQKIEVIQQ
jgi:hypothetical protein